MKNTEFYSREKLMEMPLVALRGIDVDTPEQQNLLQDVVNVKLATLPPQRPIYRKDVPDIQSPQEEAKWQEIMKQREAKIRGQADLPPVETPLTEAPTEIPPANEPTVTLPVSELGMAQASGEGEAVTLSTGVSPKLTKSGKPDRRIKVK